MQFIPIVVVLQIFFCGLVPLNSLPHWTVYFSKILPLTYAIDALSDVVLKSADLIDILPDLLGLDHIYCIICRPQRLGDSSAIKKPKSINLYKQF